MNEKDLFLTPGKIVADNPVSLRLAANECSTHIAVNGGSGKGKSKLIELFCRQLISKGVGFTYIDPHGDGCEALLPYLALQKVELSRLHILKPGVSTAFRLDPFAYPPPRAPRIVYESWLASTVDRVTRAFLRSIAAADQDIMNRMKRWTKNVLFACGVAIDGKNTHVGMDKALIFTDPQRPEFDGLLDLVACHLPPDTLADFQKLRATKRPQDQEKWVESTINRLREVLGGSPIIREMFAPRGPSVNHKQVILDRGIRLLNLRKSDLLSRDQGNIIGGLDINLLLNAAENLAEELPPEQRVPHFLIIDEAENFIGEDLRMGFAELRKFKLILVVAFQDLSCLRKGDLDLVNKVVSQCGLQMTFQQQNPEDVEFLGKAFGYGSLDMTPLMVNEVLPDGHDWVTTKSVTFSHNTTRGRSALQSRTQTQSHTQQSHTGESIQRQVSLALSQSHAEGTSTTVTDGKTEGTSVGTSEGSQHGVSENTSQNLSRNFNVGGVLQSEVRSAGGGQGLNSSHSSSQTVTRNSATQHSESHGTNSADTSGLTLGQSLAKGKTKGHSQGHSEGASAGATIGQTEGQGDGMSIGYQQSPLAKHKITEKHSGKLVMSVQDQLFAIMNKMASLPDRVVLVKCKGLGTPFLLRVHDVADAYEAKGLTRSAAWRADNLKRLLDKIHKAHAFYFQPGLVDPEEELQRLLSSHMGADAPLEVERGSAAEKSDAPPANGQKNRG